MRRFSALLALTLAAAPAFGGAVYVPMLDDAIPGVTLTPRVLVANSATSKKAFTQYTILDDANGVTRATDPTSFEVGPGDVKSATVNALAGMIEFAGSSDMAVSATLVASNAQQAEVSEIVLPIIDSDTALDGGTTAHLLGLQRDPSSYSLVAITNVSQTASTCVVNIFDAQGTSLVNPVTLIFKPLSLRRFPDALSGVPNGTAALVRLSVTCTGSFHAFGVVVTGVGTADQFLALVEPAATGASTLEVPDPGNPSGCPSGDTCFSLPGFVFQSTKSDPDKAFSFQVPASGYGKVSLKLEFFHGGWNPKNPKGGHAMFYLVQNGNRDLIGYGFMRGPGNAVVQFNHGINATADKKRVKKVNKLLTPGETYLVEYVWNGRDKTTNMTIRLKRDNSVVVSLTDETNVRGLLATTADRFILGLSNPGHDLPEPASLGSKWSNISLQFHP